MVLMNDFKNWLKANLAKSAFAAEQLRLEAERRRQEEELRPYLQLHAPDACPNPADDFPPR